MPKKRKTKKYNPNKTAPVLADNYLRRNKLAVWFTCNMKNAEVLSIPKQTLFIPNSVTASFITDYPHFWNYTLIVFCRDQKKQEYIVTGEPELASENGIPLSKRRLKQADLAAALNTAHIDFMKENVNSLHVANTGWLAFPYNCELSEEAICKIADKHNVWNYKTKWETEVQSKIKSRQETVNLIQHKPVLNKSKLDKP